MWNKKQEGGDTGTIFSYIWYSIWVITFFIALYLSFKCNGGFRFGDFVAAFCCSPIYVAYRLAVGCGVVV
jgi:hypothetical protein